MRCGDRRDDISTQHTVWLQTSTVNGLIIRIDESGRCIAVTRDTRDHPQRRWRHFALRDIVLNDQKEEVAPALEINKQGMSKSEAS